MDAEPTFGSDSEAINYWRKLAKERQVRSYNLADIIDKNSTTIVKVRRPLFFWVGGDSHYFDLRKDDFDELQEMSADYEKEMDATLSKLESEKKTLETQNGRLMQELETYREKQKERHQIAQTEIEKLKDLLNKESDERVSF